MRVILLKDQRSLGKRGEEVAVKPGFGRNYLIPQGFALEATHANRVYFEQQRKKIDAHHVKERGAALEVAEQLANVKITISKRVGDSGVLYGSVTSMDIQAALEEKGVSVDRRKLDLPTGLKTIGDHAVNVDLHADVVGVLTVSVVGEE